jgi:hypothetical protein
MRKAISRCSRPDRSSGTAQIISRSGTDFGRVVTAIRTHAADKEVPGDDSPLAQLSRQRR